MSSQTELIERLQSELVRVTAEKDTLQTEPELKMSTQSENTFWCVVTNDSFLVGIDRSQAMRFKTRDAAIKQAKQVTLEGGGPTYLLVAIEGYRLPPISIETFSVVQPYIDVGIPRGIATETGAEHVKPE